MCGYFTRAKHRFLFLFLFLVTGFFLVTAVPGPASADTVGPRFANIFPANGANLTSGKVTISLEADDPDMVNSTSVIMTVDNTAVKPLLQYGWIDEYTDDYTKLEIHYPANLSSGVHNVTVTVKDRLNNSSSVSFSFTVGSPPPQITMQQPVNGSEVNTLQPIISAKIINSGSIDPSTIVMTVNGSPVPAVFDPLTSVVSYTPVNPLNNEANYDVSLSVKDKLANVITSAWLFYASTFPEMPLTLSDNACQQCHNRTKHPMTSCTKCHGVNLNPSAPKYPLDDCYNCHFQMSNPPSYHTNGLPYSLQANHRPQSTDSCLVCHNQTWSTGIPSLHNEANTGARHITTSEGCSACHAKSLSREHQRRTDANGQSLTCLTCHNNPSTRIQDAIKNKNSNCTACHDLGPTGGHPAHDNNGLDSKCQTCHSGSILTEPQFHQKNGCQVCHSSQRDIVKYSIKTKDTNCFSCHNQGHNVNFVRQIPSDIPQYSGFEWTVPQNAAIWTGESWMPAEYNTIGAKMVISNRLQGLAGTDVFNWYEQQMTANGWQKSGGPAAGSDNFRLTYTKGTRMATVILYTGETHDPASAYVGYRLEILYK